VAWQVVIERPRHGPRFLASFRSSDRAEAYRARLIAEQPAWERFLRVVYTGLPTERAVSR
jgi:hypothetical protein